MGAWVIADSQRPARATFLPHGRTPQELSPMQAQERVGSNLLEELGLPQHAGGSEQSEDAARSLGAGSFTTYYTWRGNGVVEALRFNHGSINANSRVFV